MPPVTGEPPLGGEEAADVANHEKGRPPDEIYSEDDRMDTSSRRFPSASTKKSTKRSAKDSKRLGRAPECAFWDSEEAVKLEHSLQEQRAWMVHSTWASIENVRKISRYLLVNKPQCEHIADHFKVTGDVLEKLGLGKDDFVSGQVLKGGSDNHTFDEMHFSLVAKTFEKHLYERNSAPTSEIREVLRKFGKYFGKPNTPIFTSLDSLSVQNVIRLRYLGTMESMKGPVKAQSGYRVQHRLDEFLYLLFEVVKYGEDLVLFHSGLEGANNGVVECTGLYGEKFVQIHELLYKLLDCYACLEHCEGTEFARGYLPEHDSCRAQSLLYYLNSNCLGEYASLSIMDYFFNIELATTLSEFFKRPNCALKILSIESSPGVKVDQEELCKCRLMIIVALSKCESITSLTVRGPNGEEVHELCKSLSVNKVLETLVISTDGPLADNDAMDLIAMLKENRSLKSLTLEFDGVSPEGVVYLRAILTEISLDEIYLRPRLFRRVDLKYLLRLSMAYIDGKRNAILSVNDGFYYEIRRSVFEGWELPAGRSGDTEILRIIKNLNSFFIRFTNLDLDVTCEILDSLKKNKTLQVLEIEAFSPQNEVNRGVAVCLESLLAANSSLRILKVEFCEWHKCFVQHLLRPLMVEKDGEPQVNTSLKQLHIIKYLDIDSGEAIESIARMVRTNKTLSHFSFINAQLKSSDICIIVDSLKINKDLQVFDLEVEVLDDPQVKEAFIDLLVNYNFSLRWISRGSRLLSIEQFTKTVLVLDAEMALQELQSRICTSLDSSSIRGAHNLKQVVGTLQREEGEGSTKEGCGSSKMSFDKHKSKVEAEDERPLLFLSYSNEMRDFAMQLRKELKSSNYNVVDQDSINFAEIVDQCQLAIVVLSDMYMNSKPLMSELCTIVQSKTKVYPIFYKLTLHDLLNAHVHVNTIGGKGSSSDIALEREALKLLCERKSEVSRKGNDLVHNLRQLQGLVDVGKFCEEFSELQRRSWPSNGLEFVKNAVSKEGYVHAIVEEILYYMPVVKEYNNDQTSGHQSKLEMESKLSIRQMKSLLESLPMREFYVLREFNMAQLVQEKYIQYSSFEEMCLPYFSPEQKYEYSKGRIAAALFPTTFLYNFKVRIFQGPNDENFLHMLKAIAILVAKKMQEECNENGVQSSTFFDFVDYGALHDPRKMIAICQSSALKTSDGSTLLIIVQDDLTGAYYYQCVEASELGKLAIDDTLGVIGVEVTPTAIHVDNIHDDGSYYSGVLGDFSYKFGFDEDKQCATKAFGDLVGAKFLSENRGIKCSPLLIIALASAIKKKGLTLTWCNGKGHMEFYPKRTQKVEVEASECQVLYTGKINQLGSEIEWGIGTNSSALHNQNEIQELGSNVDKSVGTSGAGDDGTPHNQTFQRGTNETQVPGSNMNQSVGTSDAGDGTLMKMDHKLALLNIAAQDNTTLGVGGQAFGVGLNATWQTHDSCTQKMKNGLQQEFFTNLYKEHIGRVHAIPDLDCKHPGLQDRLLQSLLHEVPDHNYLVVYNESQPHDNVSLETRHVSIYEAIERDERVLELTWISEFLIDGGEKQIQHIFETGLKGKELTVTRDSSFFTQTLKPSAKIRRGFLEALLKFPSKLSGNAIDKSMTTILEPNLVDRLKSQNEWVHIIGPQAKYSPSNKYWWKATSMEAMVYSRTIYKSGRLLTTETKLPFNGIDHIGYCSVQEDSREEDSKKSRHRCGAVISHGKFSRPPGSLLDIKVLWGGLEIQ